MSYAYWDNFFIHWKNLHSNSKNVISQIQPILGWQSPNITPLMNSNSPNDFSIYYLPEPWWGNNGSYPLNAVIINYNPGKAKPIQHINNFQKSAQHNSYSQLVGQLTAQLPFRYGTGNWWHKVKRADVIFDTLQCCGFSLQHKTLSNYLGIELIPWHTTSIQTINGYVKSNAKQILLHCLVFAANESKRINNCKLQNKVILRLSGNNTKILLDYLGIIYKQSTNCHIVTPSGNGAAFKFHIPNFPTAEFISIWGKNARNNFPPKIDMIYIFNNFI